ncbi:hypothetical protein [Pedobacter alluvionis]|uniref:Uncharacterized protein n=1 Tax=Pedobacter alluvionis TaxID=475253 RepID=A0A497YA77_9SPHI|nr:hypothetical protein [Pedobacter alluvionis]RLJ80464.1 hypothetical protein BCL90_1239 [Pedobacter alluvionis]TFB31737.1 hypothetical protein E3V97_14235 [Pedobacter alluvionis]
MSKKNYLILGGIVLIIAIYYTITYVLGGISNMGNPTGGRNSENPFFITNEQITVKKILVPKGTKLIYEHFFKEGQQEKLMNENKLIMIELPEGKTIDWGGVPVYRIVKFANPEMRGFSISTNFDKLTNYKKTKFSRMLESAGCIDDLGITVKNIGDWSCNSNNITEVDDCGVNAFIDIDDEKNTKKQQLPVELYKELKK